MAVKHERRTFYGRSAGHSIEKSDRQSYRKQRPDLSLSLSLSLSLPLSLSLSLSLYPRHRERERRQAQTDAEGIQRSVKVIVINL